MRSLKRLLLALAMIVAASSSAMADDTPAPKHKVTQSETYLMLDPLYATVMDAGRPCGMLMVTIGIDIPDAGLRTEAEHMMPVLRDHYVRNLMSFTATAVRPWLQPDVETIASRLQHVTDHTLQRKGARVLLAQVSMRISR